MKSVLSLMFAGFLLAPVTFVHAEETVTEKAKETATDVKKSVKKGAHRAQEKGCEMVNGKLQCLDEKVKNRGEEVKDEVKDMAD
ncbi:hypothetical protein D3C87_1589110 [compost metagenome]